MIVHIVRSRNWLFLFLLLIGVSCIDKPVKENEGSQFIDLSAFIHQQIELLDSINPAVRKKVQVGSTVEEKVIQDVNWTKELSLFTEADISKPALASSYRVQQESNRVKVFVPRQDENMSVKYLKVEIDEKTNQPVALEAIIRQANYLYESEWQIRMKNRIINGDTFLIESYEIDGFQKLIFNDRVPYNVHAEVISLGGGSAFTP